MQIFHLTDGPFRLYFIYETRGSNKSTPGVFNIIIRFQYSHAAHANSFYPHFLRTKFRHLQKINQLETWTISTYNLPSAIEFSENFHSTTPTFYTYLNTKTHTYIKHYELRR